MTDTGMITVQSDLCADGTYIAAVHFGDDQSITLGRDAALRYAATVHAAATRADHDAAVLAQMMQLGVPAEAAAPALQGLRDVRLPLDDYATAPLRLNPCVSATRRVGYLEVFIAGHLVGQWETADARKHASDVLTVIAAVDLDTAYHRFLVATVGIDQAKAHAVVDDLAAHLSAGEGRG